MAQFHENLSREQQIEGPSERSFGITFAVVFLIVGLWPLLWGEDVRAWALALTAAFLLTALVRPSVLSPLNRLWLKFGLLLHRVTTPLMLGVIFFLVVLPTGLLMRLMGKRPLHLGLERDRASYWVTRDAAAHSATMRNQF